eukprot:15446861-Alexandrium_andersonii.AAC.1
MLCRAVPSSAMWGRAGPCRAVPSHAIPSFSVRARLRASMLACSPNMAACVLTYVRLNVSATTGATKS